MYLWSDYHQQHIRWQKASHQFSSLQSLQRKQNLTGMVEQAKEVEAKIQALERLLSQKNIKIPKNMQEHAGGPSEEEQPQILDVEWFSQQEDLLDSLIHDLKYLPLGRPHHGVVTSRFGRRANPFSGLGRENHEGIDFRGVRGDPVKATAAGTVVIAGWHRGYGRHVKIDHGNGYQTLYAHLSKIEVKRGQKISTSSRLGRVGSTGRSTGPHLHYEVIFQGTRQNPIHYLS